MRAEDVRRAAAKRNIASLHAVLVYDVYPKKVARKYALQMIEKLLLSGEIDFETLLVRTKSYAELVKGTRGTDDWRFVPNPSTWFNQGRYDDDEVLAECAPAKRLKILFEAWWKPLKGTRLVGMDFHEARYVWLHLRKLDREIPIDLHEEAGNSYNWCQGYFGSIYAGEAPTDIMTAVKELQE